MLPHTHTQLPHLILGAGEHGSREFPNINVPFADLPPPARNSVVNSYPFPIILKPESLNYNRSRNEPHSILSAWFGALLCLTQFKGRERVDFVTPEKWKWKSVSRIRLFVTHELYNPWILQARTLEWVALPFSRGSSQPRDRTQVSHIAGGFFTNWAMWEAQATWKGLSLEEVTVFKQHLRAFADASSAILAFWWKPLSSVPPSKASGFQVES